MRAYAEFFIGKQIPQQIDTALLFDRRGSKRIPSQLHKDQVKILLFRAVGKDARATDTAKSLRQNMLEITGNKLFFGESNLLLAFIILRITGEECYHVVLDFSDPAVTEGSLVGILAEITQDIINGWIRRRIGQSRVDTRSAGVSAASMPTRPSP